MQGPSKHLCRKTIPSREKCLFTLPGFIFLNNLYLKRKLSGIDAGTATKVTTHHYELEYMGRNHFFSIVSQRKPSVKRSAQANSQKKSHTHYKDSTTLTDGSEFDCWNAPDLKPMIVPLTDFHCHFSDRPNTPMFTWSKFL